MTDRRWAALVAVVFAAALLYGWGNAFAENPPSAYPTSTPTALTVRVPYVTWNVSGCDVPLVTDSGGSYPAGGTATFVGHLVNKSPSDVCEIESGSVAPSEFPVVRDTLPATINASSSVDVSFTVAVPAWVSASNVSVALAGSD